MSDILPNLLSLSSAVLAFCTGLIAYKRLKNFYRLLFFQVLTYLMLDCISIPFIPHNSWVINILIPSETALLFAAAYTYFGTTKSKYILLLLYTLFLVIYLCDILFFTGINNFAYHASITEGVLATGIFITVLYFQLDQGMNLIDSWPVTLICLGMVVYFAGSIPYLSTLFYFQKMDPVLNLKLFKNIVELLAHLRYVCLAVGFYLTGKEHSAVNSKSN
jgi:hypothetical protein